LGFYYVTYVLKLTGYTRSAVIASAGMAAGMTESLMNIFYVWIFGQGDGRTDLSGSSDRRMLHTIVVMRVINAVLTSLLLGIITPSIAGLFCWGILCRICICGFSFWRVSAQCWMVDEDFYSNGTGEKREGTIFGALGMTQSFAAAVLSGITFLAVGMAGLKTRNCEEICGKGKNGATNWGCNDRCLQETIEMQPETVTQCIRFILAVVAPTFELLIAYHSYSFPIKGLRLRRLYGLVQQQRGQADEAAVGIRRCTTSSNREVVEEGSAQKAGSKIVLKVHESQLAKQTWTDRLLFTTMLVGRSSGPKSVAVIFDMLDADILSRQSSYNSFAQPVVSDASSAPDLCQASAAPMGDSSTAAAEQSTREPTVASNGLHVDLVCADADARDSAPEIATERQSIQWLPGASKQPQEIQWPGDSALPNDNEEMLGDPHASFVTEQEVRIAPDGFATCCGIAPCRDRLAL